VHFYAREETLVATVADVLGAGLAGGDGALLAATPEHREAFARALAEAGVDVEGARRAGRYVELDAAATLGRLAAGEPLASVVGHTDAHRRIYGELVALRWERDDVEGALALEREWNDLAGDEDFTLLCGYPDDRREHQNAVCGLHTVTLPDPETVPDGGGVARRFEPTPFAAPAARAFVAGVLRSWGVPDNDARLVVTELATNAIKHARGRFVVRLTRDGDLARLAVTDSSPFLPSPRADVSLATGGRGVHLVASLSRRWGATTHDGGKTVWADLAC
jgi:signal transduction histidine kinase